MDSEATDQNLLVMENFSQFLKDLNEKYSKKSEFFRQNKNAFNDWPDESDFSLLDSSLKKNTAFVKKIRVFNENQKESILNDAKSLNLTKYIAEITQAFFEAKFKITDIPFLMKLCSQIHQKYHEFHKTFISAWRRHFPLWKDNSEVNYLFKKVYLQPSNYSRYRVDLVIFAELVSIGIFDELDGMKLLSSQLSSLINSDKSNLSHISVVIFFCKHCGDDWAGLIPYSFKIMSEKLNKAIPSSYFLPFDKQTRFKNLLLEYFSCANQKLEELVKAATQLTKANKKQFENRGELREESKQRAEQLGIDCRKLHENIYNLSEILSVEPPPSLDELLKNLEQTEEDLDEALVQESKEGDTLNTLLFDDEESRQFYENLPDIKLMLPGTFCKEAENYKQTAEPEDSSDTLNAEETDEETFKKLIDAEESTFQTIAIEAVGVEAPTEEDTAFETELDVTEVLNTDSTINSNFKEELGKFLNTLPNCINRDLIDKAALNFCINFNKKSCHRALVQKIFACPRNRLDLIPFYARLVANLNPIMPWITEELNQLIINEFHSNFKPKRLAFYIESKIRNAKFIAELIKFKLFPSKSAFNCIRRLLEHFSGHSIEVVCFLLDTCGRFLSRSRGTSQKTKVFLEILMRKKRATRLEAKYEHMIVNSYVLCNPHLSISRKPIFEKVSPLEQFLRRILWKDLCKDTLTATLRIVRKINWKDSTVLALAIKMFSEAWNLAFHKIEYLASILSGLATYHTDLSVGVVDCVLEEIKVMIEINDPKYNQRRVSIIKYLGLLYNYRLVEANIIFNTLYLLITYGCSYDFFAPDDLDPPESVFRIQLVCTLLDTCGHYFESGNKKRKLAIFLLYFQRYYWFKRSLPFFIQFPSEGEESLFGENEQNENGKNDPSDMSNLSTIKWTPYSFQQFLLSNNPKLRPQTFPYSVKYTYEEYFQSQRSGVVKTKSLDHCERLIGKLEAKYLATISIEMDKQKKRLNKGLDKPLDSISEEQDLLELETGEDLGIIEEEEESEIHRPKLMSFQDDDEFVETNQEEGEKDDLQSSDNEDNDTSDDTSTVVDSGSCAEDDLLDEKNKPTYIECEEDLEFQRLLDQMTTDARFSSTSDSQVVNKNVTGAVRGRNANQAVTTTLLNTSGTLGTKKVSTSVPVLPSLEVVRAKYLFKPKSETIDSTNEINTPFINSLGNINTSNELLQVEREAKSSIKFTLLTRKKNNPSKLNALPIDVPETVDFVAKYLKESAEEAEDKRLLKASVLRMHQEQKDQDDFSDLNNLNQQILASSQQRYQHPRGVPDTSAIFGNYNPR